MLLCSEPALGADSDWAVRTWQIPDGSANFVTGVLQSPDGYLWASTSAGLNQFDGQQFHYQRLGALLGLQDSLIRAMLRTRDGAVWAAMDGNVVVLNIGKPPRVITSRIPALRALSMQEDHDGAVWISYFSGPICRITGDRVDVLGPEADIPVGSNGFLATDNAGRIWFSRDGHVGFMHDGKFSERHGFSGLTSIAAARDGGVWVVADFQLYKMYADKDATLIAPLPFKRAQPEAVQIVEDSAGGLWLGTSTGGLFRFDASNGFVRISTPQARITSLYQDHEGNIWAGTDAGLDRISPRVVQLKGAESGLPLGGITSICQTADGRKWAAAADGELMLQTAEQWQRAPFWNDNFATCVTADDDGSLWIGTKGRRLFRWQHDVLSSWGTDQGLQPHPITALFAAGSGEVWIGSTASNKLQSFRHNHFVDFDIPPGNGQVCTILADHAGNIWVGRTGKGGLFRITGTTVVSLIIPTAYNTVHHICLGADDTLWAACYATGVARVKAGKLTMITAAQGLYDDHISQIVRDDRGGLWFGSDHGVFRIEEKQLNALADGKIPRVQSVQYGGDEGLPILQAKYGYGPSTLCARDGRLFMTMATNLVSISPANVPAEVPPPQVQVERVMIDDAVVAAYGSLLPVTHGFDLAGGKPLRIPSNYRRLQIDFTALSFLAPANVHFEYQLRNYDDAWTQGEPDRRAPFPRLPPGDYHFVVRACNGNGIWNDTGTSIAFTITPALWQRWWFFPAAILLFTSIVVIVARYVSLRRLRARLRLLEHQTAVARERSRIARDLHDDLGARLTNIIMLTERSLREPNHNSHSGDLVRHVATGVRQAIKSLDETVWAVNPRNDTLPHMINYIGQSSVEYLRTANIRCRVKLIENSPDREVSAEIRHNVLLVVKEALNNIVRHARATDVVLAVSIEQKMICLTIEDNGQGFDTIQDDAFADGLRNMRQRMDEIGGNFEIVSEAGAGTRILLFFPWSRQTQ